MKIKIKKILLIVLLLIFLVFLYLGAIAGIAYLDWDNNKSRLLENLTEYHQKIKNYSQKDRYLILDDEGKVIEIQPSIIFDRNNKMLGEFSPTKREIVQLSSIPENLIESLILIEDMSFYKHKGVNLRGIIRAFLKNILSFKVVEGGSSLTQQLAKILFTSRRRNLYRKFLELYGALAIEKHFEKKEIIHMYLNTVYFGHGAYGVQSAAKLYFNKNVRNLNPFETALLISIIPAPNYFSPYNNIELAKKKHLTVLNKLKKHKMISDKRFQKRYKKYWINFSNKIDISSISYWKMNINNAPYVNEYIRQYLSKNFTVSEILQGTLKVSTTIDLDIQRILQKSVKEYIRSLEISLFTNKKYQKNLQIAVVITKPQTGEILGFVGGKKYTFRNQLNRAINMKRQVGSSIKPFIYASAIEEEMFTMTTILTDKPISYKDKNRIYSPKNYSSKYRGSVLLRNGLIKSINTISVQILNTLSPQKVINNYLDRIYEGTGTEVEFLPVLSLALGTVEMSPYELAQAYNVLANSGKKVLPIIINRVKNRYDEDIIDNISTKTNIMQKWEKNANQFIFSQGTCYIIADTLKKVFSNEGTARMAIKRNPLKVELCGKTGTTSNFKDAWCVGYTRDYVVVVWIGFDDYKQTLGKGMTGGRLASPLILKIFDKIYWNRSYQDFTIPTDEVTFCNVSAKSGKLATSSTSNIIYNVPYKNGTQPQEY